jgi:hypothetical protein
LDLFGNLNYLHTPDRDEVVLGVRGFRDLLKLTVVGVLNVK